MGRMDRACDLLSNTSVKSAPCLKKRDVELFAITSNNW